MCLASIGGLWISSKGPGIGMISPSPTETCTDHSGIMFVFVIVKGQVKGLTHEFSLEFTEGRGTRNKRVVAPRSVAIPSSHFETRVPILALDIGLACSVCFACFDRDSFLCVGFLLPDMARNSLKELQIKYLTNRAI
jgi:hypothetical protein